MVFSCALSLVNTRGALACQLCTDGCTKNRKTYPIQCVRHFEIDAPFHCVQSKSNPFQSSKLKRILSYFSTFCIFCKKNIPFSYKNSIFPTLNDDSAAHCTVRIKVPVLIVFCSRISTQLTSKRPPPPGVNKYILFRYSYMFLSLY